MSSIVARLWTGLLAVVVVSSHAWAQQPPEGPPLPVWGPNGFVHAMARVGNTLFVGGEFDDVGPPTGAFVTVGADDATSVTAPSPSILGPVQVVTADGGGGWFVVERPPFASGATAQVVHVRPDGSRDPAWIPPTFAPASVSQQVALGSLAVDQGRLFVSGAFAAVNGTARTGLAALDVGTGSLLSWGVQLEGPPGANVSVEIGAATPGRLYLTGLFTSVNGVTRLGRAAVDTVTAALMPFDPPGPLSTTVVAATATTVYARCMAGLCAYDLTGTPLASWSSPVAAGQVGPVAVTATALYTTVAEGPAQRLIAVDPGTGAPLGWTGALLSGVGAAAIRPAGRPPVPGR